MGSAVLAFGWALQSADTASALEVLHRQSADWSRLRSHARPADSAAQRSKGNLISVVGFGQPLGRPANTPGGVPRQRDLLLQDTAVLERLQFATTD